MPAKKKCVDCGAAQPVVKRSPNKYNEFVRTHINSEEVGKLPAKERMKAVAEIWRKNKELPAEGEASAKCSCKGP